jgi:hypothetical protein
LFVTRDIYPTWKLENKEKKGKRKETKRTEKQPFFLSSLSHFSRKEKEGEKRDHFDSSETPFSQGQTLTNKQGEL